MRSCPQDPQGRFCIPSPSSPSPSIPTSSWEESSLCGEGGPGETIHWQVQTAALRWGLGRGGEVFALVDFCFYYFFFAFHFIIQCPHLWESTSGRCQQACQGRPWTRLLPAGPTLSPLAPLPGSPPGPARSSSSHSTGRGLLRGLHR